MFYTKVTSKEHFSSFLQAFLLLWIIVSFLFIYHSGIAQYIYDSINNNNSTISSATNKVPRVKDHIQYLSKEFMDDNPLSDHKLNGELERGISSFPLPLKELQVTPITYQEPESSLAEGTERFLLSLWLSNKQHWRFSAWHWPALLNFYNISLSNRWVNYVKLLRCMANMSVCEQYWWWKVTRFLHFFIYSMCIQATCEDIFYKTTGIWFKSKELEICSVESPDSLILGLGIH